MSPTLSKELDGVFDAETRRLNQNWPSFGQRAAEQAAAAGPGFPSVGILFDHYSNAVRDKAAAVMDAIERTLTAYGEQLASQDVVTWSKKFNAMLDSDADRVVETLRASARGGIEQNQLARARLQLTPHLDELKRDFRLALVAKANSAESLAPVHHVTVHGGNVVVGNNNQQTVIHVFQEILTKIDGSKAPEAEKAEAKSRLLRFFEHPVVKEVEGAVAGAVIKALMGG